MFLDKYKWFFKFEISDLNLIITSLVAYLVITFTFRIFPYGNNLSELLQLEAIRMKDPILINSNTTCGELASLRTD